MKAAGRELYAGIFEAYNSHIMQDTNKNAIWIFVVIIVVLGIIWATSSKSGSDTSMENASTTPMVSDEADSVVGDDTITTSVDANGVTSTNTTVKSPTLPAAGIGPKE